MNDPDRKDIEHLRQLVICHFTAAGLAVLGVAFIAMHYLIFSTIMSDPKVIAQMQHDPLMPDNFFAIFRWFYVVFGGICIVSAIVNVVSALYMRRRRHRTFSLVVAGINCIHMPLGTVLGILTFIVLGRESVIRLYANEKGGGTLAPPPSIE